MTSARAGAYVVRGLSLVVACAGLLLYGWFVYVFGVIEWQQQSISDESNSYRIWYFIQYPVFMSGLPPLILVVYFLILRKDVRANVWGLVFVALSVPVHATIAAVTAHQQAVTIYLPLQALELAVALVLVAVWHLRVRRTRTEHVR